ncbi:MAG: CPBP family intramembrane metalloprotease [Sciscionella sp.]|nr:CPBP family intramembrane metalloprotease [Sciscionella sp.]
MPSRLRSWLAPAPPATIDSITEPQLRRGTGFELAIVFGVTLGLSGLRSLISLADSLLAPQPLNQQSVAIAAPQAHATLLDLAAQLADVLQLACWGALGLYLLWRNGILLASIGLTRYRRGSDTLAGAGLAALIGIPGLGFYFLARMIGIDLNVQPSVLTDTWWRIPVLILAAVGNAWAEETLVVGYLITRLRQLGRRENTSLLISATLRGSYHLYQGFGGFIGNLIMGCVFGRWWQRTNRLWPLIVAHSLLDIVSFVGYALLRNHVSWL